VTDFTRRVRVVLTGEQYDVLARLSTETGKPLSELIRDAVEQVYLKRAQRERRRSALQRLLALDAPVAEWERMEEQIIQGAAA
jgi:hypothetical protein